LTHVHTGDLRHAVKTDVAAASCLYVTDFFKLPQGYWAAISAMIVLQSSVGATVNAWLNRLAGTAIGAVLGGLFVKLWGSHVWAFGAATITVWSCVSLGLRDSYRLASATVALVMLTRFPGGHLDMWLLSTQQPARAAPAAASSVCSEAYDSQTPLSSCWFAKRFLPTSVNLRVYRGASVRRN
jgi:Fusaric acid resistance protein-like